VSNIPRVAVFASGGGSNLQSLLDTFGGPDGGPDPACQIALVVSDRPGIGALDRADKHGVPTAVVKRKEHESGEAFGQALLDVLGEHHIDLIALAGFLKLVPENVVAAYRGRMLNIHPGPLPTFGGSGMWGHHVHEAVLDSGVAVSGPSIHFVDERYDTGPIIAQWPVPVMPGDTADSLAARVLKYEHRLYPAVLGALARGEIEQLPDGKVRKSRFGTGDLGFQLTDEQACLDSVGPAWKR
jgi:formyltetrahydrofolate-dependent phosphoribosylglycinamide formyltransferase